MTLRDLIKNWERTASAPLTQREFRLRLTVSDAAKIAALTEMYPARNAEQIRANFAGDDRVAVPEVVSGLTSPPYASRAAGLVSRHRRGESPRRATT